ncbi:MAG TPA: M28 family peptidase [Chitinophagaceae bacterium]|nr:M28 family peptidase [Chitinophagaceae bacterium]
MKRLLLFFLFLWVVKSYSQDLAFARKMVDTLSSPFFWGRGYTNEGMKKTASFLAEQFRSYGLEPMNGTNFLQTFSYPVNTFPGNMELTINGKELVAGRDFLVSAESRGLKAKGELQQKDSAEFINIENRLLVRLENKLTWAVSMQEADHTVILLDRSALPNSPSSFKINIDNKLVREFKAANVCGVVKGKKQPDSVLLITAHYDHLGGMGKHTYFPGANDNASGISLLLNLARYYAANPPDYSIGFICFAGEEAGLVGSRFFTENPLIALKNIRFLVNTDLAGTGEEGITVVNATEFPREFGLMNAVNAEHKLLAAINARGKAANSDHYFFTEKGVPAFFFYTLGGIKAYHDIFDKAETLPLSEHEDLFRLVVKFNEKLMGK